MTSHGVLDSPSEVSKILCPSCSEKISLADRTPFKIENCNHCEAPFEVPLQIEQYLLETVLNDNGIVCEYQAIDLLLNRHVLIKKLNKAYFDVERTPGFPFVESSGAVNVFSTIVYENELYLVSELVQGRSIENYLESRGSVDQIKVISLAISTASILAEAAELEIHHGNLLPSSIWVDENGAIRITDFMLYQNILTGHDTEEKLCEILDIRYSSSDRLMSVQVSEKSDLFNFGMCIHEMLTGKLPNDSTELEGLLQERQNVFTDEYLLAAGIDSKLIVIVMKLLSGESYASFTELEQSLKAEFIVSKPKSGKSSKKAPSKSSKKGKPQVKLPGQAKSAKGRTRAMTSKSKLKKLFR